MTDVVQASLLPCAYINLSSSLVFSSRLCSLSSIYHQHTTSLSLPLSLRGSNEGGRLRTRLCTAYQTALACGIVACATLYGPKHLRHELSFPAFSYVTVILIASEATLGDAISGCWQVVYATTQVVPASMLVLWLIKPQHFSPAIAAAVVAVGSFLVGVVPSTELLAKRIAYGQIVIVCISSVVHREHAGVVQLPFYVAMSTMLGGLASVIALLLPLPRPASSEVRRLCQRYANTLSERFSLIVKAFSAQDKATALDAISQSRPFAASGAKLLKNIKLAQDGVIWERPQLRLSKSRFVKPSDRLKEMEIPVRGMEIAITSCPSFPLGFNQELSEVLSHVETQIALKLEQARRFLPSESATAPEARDDHFNTYRDSLGDISPNTKDLNMFFFLFCLKLLQDDSKISQPNLKESELTQLVKGWFIRPRMESVIFALKCSLSLCLAVFVGMTYSTANGYWSGITVAISFTERRQATFIITNARAQGTAIGSVYGVLGCFLFRSYPDARLVALLPWLVFISFLRHSRMYGEAGGIPAAIGALLILGRKDYGLPPQFAITRLTESCIGLFLFVLCELLLQPTRASTLAKNKLSEILAKLKECIGEVELQKKVPTGFVGFREKQVKIRDCISELEKLVEEADIEPDFWFLPFRTPCYNKLIKSLTKTADLLLFMTYRMEFLAEASKECGLAWAEFQEHINGDLVLFKNNVGPSMECLQKITSIKSIADFERETSDDLELGKTPNVEETRRMHTSEEEADKIVSEFLENSKEVTDRIVIDEVGNNGQRRKNELALCLSAIGFCVGGIMRETIEIERGVKELIQWENPSTLINFHEIYKEINLCQE